MRIVTAASLFDGHDAAINIMRRIIQATGVEVIHLGHDRSVEEVVDTAIQEDAQAIALTSYQGNGLCITAIRLAEANAMPARISVLPRLSVAAAITTGATNIRAKGF